MARSEARVHVDIWDDDDFLALPPGPQRMFLFLISQRDLEHTGVVALRERRWARGAAGLTSSDVIRDLGELERARFIVVDEDSEEVLVRSFIRGDKVFKQPNVMRSAVERATSIRSAKIRAELLVELDRILATEPMSESAAAVVEEMREALAKGSGKGIPRGSADPTGMASAEPSGQGSVKGSQLRPGERGTGKGEELTDQDQNSEASDNQDDNPTDNGKPPVRRRNDKTGKLPSTDPNLTWSEKEIDGDPLFGAFWAAYPRKDDKAAARKAWLTALRNKPVTAEQLAEGAASYRSDPRRDPQFTKLPATWLNKESWANYDTANADDEPEDDPDNVWAN